MTRNGVERGGDIDLLIETDTTLPNRVDVLCKLKGRFAKGSADLFAPFGLSPLTSLWRALSKPFIMF